MKKIGEHPRWRFRGQGRRCKFQHIRHSPPPITVRSFSAKPPLEIALNPPSPLGRDLPPRRFPSPLHFALHLVFPIPSYRPIRPRRHRQWLRDISRRLSLRQQSVIQLSIQSFASPERLQPMGFPPVRIDDFSCRHPLDRADIEYRNKQDHAFETTICRHGSGRHAGGKGRKREGLGKGEGDFWMSFSRMRAGGYTSFHSSSPVPVEGLEL